VPYENFLFTHDVDAVQQRLTNAPPEQQRIALDVLQRGSAAERMLRVSWFVDYLEKQVAQKQRELENQRAHHAWVMGVKKNRVVETTPKLQQIAAALPVWHAAPQCRTQMLSSSSSRFCGSRGRMPTHSATCARSWIERGDGGNSQPRQRHADGGCGRERDHRLRRRQHRDRRLGRRLPLGRSRQRHR
jgi:hypothetical protein